MWDYICTSVFVIFIAKNCLMLKKKVLFKSYQQLIMLMNFKQNLSVDFYDYHINCWDKYPVNKSEFYFRRWSRKWAYLLTNLIQIDSNIDCLQDMLPIKNKNLSSNIYTLNKIRKDRSTGVCYTFIKGDFPFLSLRA